MVSKGRIKQKFPEEKPKEITNNRLDNNESPIKLESARSNATHVTNTGLGKLTNRLTQNEPQ